MCPTYTFSLYSIVPSWSPELGFVQKIRTCATVIILLTATTVSTPHRFESLEDIDYSAKLKHKAKTKLIDHHASNWNAELDCLQVQSKFKDIVTLESDCPIWNRSVNGLPIGHLSFLLRAGSDTLPTPLNLA